MNQKEEPETIVPNYEEFVQEELGRLLQTLKRIASLLQDDPTLVRLKEKIERDRAIVARTMIEFVYLLLELEKRVTGEEVKEFLKDIREHLNQAMLDNIPKGKLDS